MVNPDLTALLQFATPRQKEVLEALIGSNNSEEAAQKLGVSSSTVRSALQNLRRKAAAKGWAPDEGLDTPAPEGFFVDKVTTQIDDGEIKRQWITTKRDRREEFELFAEAMEEFAAPFKGQSVFVRRPRFTNEELLSVYPLGDPHIGMFAWAEETGQDFDLKTAEHNLVEAADQCVALAPPSDIALIINLGDFFHADNKSNRTERAGNILDVDTRWAKVLGVGIRTERRLIDRTLEKHKEVYVINEIGNHDNHSAIMLSLCLANYYENNPRVHVDTSPSTYHWFRFGESLIGTTHGDNTRPADLPGIMACDKKKDWGETSHRYWYCGHVHHDSLKEFPGCIVETFRTLAPGDAWHSMSGYRSGQDMKVDVFHKKYGRVNRHIVGIQQIWDADKEYKS